MTQSDVITSNVFNDEYIFLISGLGLWGNTLNTLRDHFRSQGIGADTWGEKKMNTGPTKETIEFLQETINDIYAQRVAYAKEHPELNFDPRFHIGGHSFGGLMATQLVREFPHMFKGVMTFAGCVNMSLEDAQEHSNVGGVIDAMRRSDRTYDTERFDRWVPEGSQSPSVVSMLAIVPIEDYIVNKRKHALPEREGCTTYFVDANHSSVKKGVKIVKGEETASPTPTALIATHAILHGYEAPLPEALRSHVRDADSGKEFERLGPIGLLGALTQAPRDKHVAKVGAAVNRPLEAIGSRVIGHPWDREHGTQLTTDWTAER